jgi:predicted lipoprotein with Yx(FWY)xxD motif
MDEDLLTIYTLPRSAQGGREGMDRRVRRLRFAAVVTAFGVAAAVAGASPGVVATVKTTQNSALGKILVSASGRTLYHNSFEKKNVIKCTGACATDWPPLLVAARAKPAAGPGVTASLLATIKRPDGKIQVTYRGWPLYLFSGDKKAGDVTGQGGGGIWHALSPSGVAVMKAVGSTASTGTSSGSGSGTSTGSGSSSGSSSGSGSNTGSGSGSTTTTPNDCATNPGGYGCM